MNITQAHIEFRQSLDRADSSAYPDLLSEQVDYFLNEAYNRYIKTRYTGNNPLGVGAEQIQKRTDDLRNLVITDYAATSVNSNETNTYNVSLTSLFTNEARTSASTNSYMLYFRGRAKVTSSVCGSQYVAIKIYSHNVIDDVLSDPHKKPVIYEPVGYFEGNNLNIVTDGTFTVDNFKLTYIKNPIPVSLTDNITFETASHTHKEIIELASYIALENLESQRQITKLQTLAMDE